MDWCSTEYGVLHNNVLLYLCQWSSSWTSTLAPSSGTRGCPHACQPDNHLPSRAKMAQPCIRLVLGNGIKFRRKCLHLELLGPVCQDTPIFTWTRPYRSSTVCLKYKGKLIRVGSDLERARISCTCSQSCPTNQFLMTKKFTVSTDSVLMQ